MDVHLKMHIRIIDFAFFFQKNIGFSALINSNWYDLGANISENQIHINYYTLTCSMTF